MFGFVRPYEKGLSEEEFVRFRSVYCGLCHMLNDNFGPLGRLGLNYDMTFMTILLQSLYEPAETLKMERCPLHPARKHPEAVSDITRYAADMTIILTYHKAADDWKDEKKLPSRAYSTLLRKHYDAVRARRERQCAAVEECIAAIHRVEEGHNAPPETAANLSGRMLSEIYHFRDDHFTGVMTRFGAELGRAVYMIDAAVDYGSDKRSGCFNPLIQMGLSPKDAADLIQIPLGEAAGAFESLPLEKDLNLMRNVLYSGIWQSYNASIMKKERHDHGQ